MHSNIDSRFEEKGVQHLKLIYLAKRHPALTRQQFVPRWRQHGALGMSRPLWSGCSKYRQCDAISPPITTEGVSDDYDGIGEVYFRSRAALDSDISPEDRDVMHRDELEVFTEHVENFSLLTEELILRDIGTTKLKFVSFVKRRARASRDEFEEWLDTAARLGYGLQSIACRYVQNRVIPSEYSKVSKLDYDAVIEVSAGNLPDAVSLWKCPLIEQALGLRGDALDTSRTLVVLTKEALLYDEV